MPRVSLFPVASHRSSRAVFTPPRLKTAKKPNLCFSTTPLLLRRKMHCVAGSSSESNPLTTMEADDVEDESHPLLMMEADEEDEDGMSLCVFYDIQNKEDVNTNIEIPEEVKHAICVGSSHGWLAYVSRLDCSVFLWSPFNTSPLILLPPIDTLPYVTVVSSEELDENEYKPDFVSAYEDDFSPDFGFKISCDCVHPDICQVHRIISPKLLSLRIMVKIVLSSSPTSDDCVVVAVPRHNIRRSIAFCKPGDKAWTFVDPPLQNGFHSISDVIHFKDRLFYTVSSCGTGLYAYDLSDLSSPKSYLLETSFNFQTLSSFDQNVRTWFHDRYYLVESLGDLLWVRRLISNNMNDDGEFTFSHDAQIFPDQTVQFDVYRLDFSKNTWEFTESIGDRVLFLGTNQSLSLSARDFPSLKANCIYFTDDSSSIHRKCDFGGRDFGYYELGGFAYGEYRFREDKILPPPFWVMRHFQ
ncbi:uncharacterized protein LOC133866264 [Alnus glutinosa]|uniref:uncharacterized protein LOC133866264 n=1 Tax=Alnus glutinosa TaxID=3517 RepID=UPI002D776C12|nr:uncharacterized protein LOC133866264 [Alnus glutinosa]